MTYWRDGKRESGFDSNVSESYLLNLAKYLRDGESADARCINGGREHDRWIDKDGVRRTYV